MRQSRILIAMLSAAVVAGCSRDPMSPVTPVDDPGSPGRLVYSGDAAGFVRLCWSGSTGRLYLSDQFGIQELDLGSGAVRTLVPDVWALDMAPNGRALYYRPFDYSGNRLQRIDLATEHSTVVSHSLVFSLVLSNHDLVVAYSQDRTYALVIAGTSGSSDEIVGPRGFPLAFSPDDRQVLYASSLSWYPPTNPDPLRVHDLATGLVHEIPGDIDGSPLGAPFWSDRGITIAYADEGFTRVWMRTGSVDRLLFTSPDYIDRESTSWSPDGSRFAFLTYRRQSQGRMVTAWVVEPESERVFRVAHGLLIPASPADPAGQPTVETWNITTFSPDGHSVAYTAGNKIFIAAID